jgi:hypothetical protein
VSGLLVGKRRVQSVVENNRGCTELGSLREIQKRVWRKRRDPGRYETGYGSDGVNIEETHSLRYFIFLNFEVGLCESGYRAPLRVGDDNIDGDAAHIGP